MSSATEREPMAEGDRVNDALRSTLRAAGEAYQERRTSADSQLEAAKAAYEAGRNARSLPTDEEGRSKLVCRRYAERRAAKLDERYRPACYESDHPDCEGCAEDVRDGRIETW